MMATFSATQMVAKYRAGELTLGELAADFAAREWNAPSWLAEREKMTDAQLWNAADGWDRSEVGTWGEIRFLYRTDELTADEFYRLVDAVDTANGIDEFGNDISASDAGR